MLVTRPQSANAYEFIVISALRAQQLLAGCTPRLSGEHTPMVMAQMEVAAGQVARAGSADDAPRQCSWQL
jgi:DNA-directed RNA polymerase subunit K/omega